MNLRRKNKEPRVKTSTSIRGFRLYHISLFFVLCSFISYAQDSIPAAKDLTEEKELNFQQFFFKALSEKSIGNYQKAIENLESCNQILSNNVAVFFEFSKNYFLLNNNLLAKEYINRALIKEASNIWMLKHLVKIYVKDKNYIQAIDIQKKVSVINPKERRYLVGLYMKNTEYKKAVLLLNILEKENGLPKSLKQLKKNLEKRKEIAFVKKKTDTLSLIHQFTTDKSYKILAQILKKYLDKPDVLLKYSEEGIVLFPAQPFVYLMKGKALNYQKNYKKALTILQNGLDFVIEDTMEAEFYKEMAITYKGLGNLKEEKKYTEKYRKLKS